MSDKVAPVEAEGHDDPLLGGDGGESTFPDLHDPFTSSTGPYVLGRFATYFATGHGSPGDAVAAAKRVRDALSADARVVDLVMPDLNSKFTDWDALYPYAPEANGDDLLSGKDSFLALHTSHALLFTVRVPIKNQPDVHGSSGAPTDTYYAAWDGMTLVVSWRQRDAYVRQTGGHVVLDVLDDACDRAGLSGYRQGCNSGCDFGFIHTTMFCHTPAAFAEVEFVETHDEQLVIATVSHAANPKAVALDLWMRLSSPGYDYARAKNLGQRLFDLEARVGRDSYHLLHHYHEHAKGASLSALKRGLRAWRNRGWRREARGLMSGIWLGMAGITSMSQSWAREAADLSQDRGVGALFDMEMRNDIERAERLDLAVATQTVDHLSSQLQNRSLMQSTVLGTVGGAIAGALAAALLT